MDHCEITRPIDTQLAPGSERVAFVRREPRDGETDQTVYVASTDGGGARRYTVRAGNDAEPRWSPSRNRLARTSTRGEGNDRQLWVLPTRGSEARQVTTVGGGVSEIAWEPAGEQIAFVQTVHDTDRTAGHDLAVGRSHEPEEPDSQVIEGMVYRTVQEYSDEAYAQVYIVDLTTDSLKRVTDVEQDHVVPA